LALVGARTFFPQRLQLTADAEAFRLAAA
jgi:hypothetical protein